MFEEVQSQLFPTIFINILIFSSAHVLNLHFSYVAGPLDSIRSMFHFKREYPYFVFKLSFSFDITFIL